MRKLTEMYSRFREQMREVMGRSMRVLVRVMKQRGRLRTALALAWIVILVTASFSVFRLTYGRPWFSAPASFDVGALEEISAAEEMEDSITHTAEPNGLEETTEATRDEPDLGEPLPGELLWPVGNESSIITHYGLVNCPTLKRPLYHPGIDLAADEGTPVVAALEGIVKEVTRDLKMGWQIILDHGGGVTTKYACLDQPLADQGQKVETGQVIALVGNSGLSEIAIGPHLHFEVRIDERPANPLTWLKP